MHSDTNSTRGLARPHVAHDITDAQIEQQLDEAQRYGDDFMVQICTLALGGSAGHRAWRDDHGEAQAAAGCAQKAVA